MIWFALWVGVGTGLVVADALEYGAPTDVGGWCNWLLCPILWPIAVWRRLHG